MAVNRFAIDLYGQLRKKEGNLFFSPLSVHQALTLAYAGSAGNTAAEMESALKLGKKKRALFPAFGALFAGVAFPAEEDGYSLSLANSLWGQKDHPFRPEYVKNVRKFFGAPLLAVDYKGAPDEACKRINGWVEKNTAGKIKDLVSRDLLGPLTRLVIANAIHFKGDWTHPFKEEETYPADFHVAGKGAVKVPFMNHTKRYLVRSSKECRTIRLPYGAGDLCMVVLLPPEKDGLAELEKALTFLRYATWTLSSGDRDEVRLALPRFRLESALSLKDPLVALGMKEAFDMEKANFSGASKDPKGLYVSAVVHKAFVDVNEKGTEAAAASGVIMKKKNGGGASFRVDRSFLFTIMHQKTGLILFMGRCLNPAA
jgi:serpin B